MTNKQKQQIQKHIIAIDKMEYVEVCNFSRDWYFAKPDLVEIVFKQVQFALDAQMAYLMDRTVYSAAVVMSELVEGEI